MSGAQHHAGCFVRLKCFLPTWSTQAPTIAGFQTWKAKFRHRRRKVIAARSRKIEELGSHQCAHSVTAPVLWSRIAAAVAIEARHRLKRTNFDFDGLAEHISGGPLAFSTGIVISEHDFGVRTLRSAPCPRIGIGPSAGRLAGLNCPNNGCLARPASISPRRRLRG